MILQPWPDATFCAAAPINDPVQQADWTALDELPPALRFPNAADLAELGLLIQAEKARGEQ